MTKSADKINPPDLFQTMFDFPRAFLGLFGAASKGNENNFGNSQKIGKGLIVTVPGFLEHDSAMHPMHKALQIAGFKTYESGIGTNLGSIRDLEDLIENIDRIYEENEGNEIILNGHSLGGMLALYAAYVRPEKIAQVNTFGSPVAAFGANQSGIVIGCLNYDINAIHQKFISEIHPHMNDGPPNSSVTSFYSKEDEVVASVFAQNPWDDGEKHVNICVEGSHRGMIINHKTLDKHVQRILDIQASNPAVTNEYEEELAVHI